MTSDCEQDSDDILVSRIASGQADAFTDLFRRRQSDVYRFVVHMTGLPALAEDVTQDVFVIVMREAAKYQPGRSTVPAWLCGIARNCARQRLERDRALTGIWHELSDNEGDLPAVHPDPLGDLTRAERLAMLRRAVLALPLRYREVVVLCDLQELSYAEAADVLGCAIGTIRSRLHRARNLLAVKMTARESLAHRADDMEPRRSSVSASNTRAEGAPAGPERDARDSAPRRSSGRPELQSKGASDVEGGAGGAKPAGLGMRPEQKRCLA